MINLEMPKDVQQLVNIYQSDIKINRGIKLSQQTVICAIIKEHKEQQVEIEGLKKQIEEMKEKMASLS